MYESMSHASDNNHTLFSARYSLKATEQNVKIARSEFLPQVGGSAGLSGTFSNLSGLGGDNDGGRYTESVGASVTQSVFNLQNNFNLAASKLGVNVAQASLESQEQSLLLQAVTYYVSVARDTAIYALQSRYENVLYQQYSAVTAQVDAGELTRTDQYLSEASWRGATATKIAASANLETSKATFLQIIGLEAKDMRRPYGPKSIPKNLNAAVTEAQSNNPLIIAAEQQLLQSNQLLKSARAERLPTVTASAETGYSNTFDDYGIYNDYQTNDGVNSSVSLDVNVPIFTGGRITAQVEAARATAMAAEQTLLDTQNAIQQQVTAAWESYIAAKQQVAAYKSQIAANEYSANGVRREFEVGTRSLIDLLNEDANLVTSRVNYETAKANEIIAGWSLLQAMGRLTPNTLGLQR